MCRMILLKFHAKGDLGTKCGVFVGEFRRVREL